MDSSLCLCCKGELMLGFVFNIFSRWVLSYCIMFLRYCTGTGIYDVSTGICTTYMQMKQLVFFPPIISRGIFFMYFIQQCFICRPSDSTVSENSGIEPRTVATLTLAVRRSNHSTSGWDLPVTFLKKKWEKFLVWLFLKLLIYNPSCRAKEVHWVRAGPPLPPPHRSARQACAPLHPPPPRGVREVGERGKSLCPSTPPLSWAQSVTTRNSKPKLRKNEKPLQ